ncbi:YceI family protein [Flavobacterium ajazii]|uniref:YceI family protein n=1 Tax=Flavobacterium ajazii TaxID=2692318 RepID=UPI0013D8555A|nr:YceI family protein [Flavobacterium ajazii]
MTKIKITVAILLLSLTCLAVTKAIGWKIAEGGIVKFSGDDIDGKFEKFSGTINFDATDLQNSNFSVNVEVNSIATGNWIKNKIAKGEKWFGTDMYPTINFVSGEITKTDTGYLTKGNLTMHGITKKIEIPFTFSNNVFKGKFSVNRVDYKVGNLEGMSKKVGNKINIEFSVPVKRKFLY